MHSRIYNTNVKRRYYGSGGGGGSPAGTSAAKTALGKLFDKYREAATAEADIVGVEGTMKYFQDVDVDVEGLESLAALEIVQAPTMGEMSREGFVNGWQERKLVPHCGVSCGSEMLTSL